MGGEQVAEAEHMPKMVRVIYGRLWVITFHYRDIYGWQYSSAHLGAPLSARYVFLSAGNEVEHQEGIGVAKDPTDPLAGAA